MNIKEKLRILHKTPEKLHTESQAMHGPDYKYIANQLGGCLIESTHGDIIRIIKRVTFNEIAESAILQQVRDIPGKNAAILSKNKVEDNFSFRSALFIDTETTGLTGSSGTYAFLVGVGYFQLNEFVVELLFMPGLGDEQALLVYLENLLSERTGIVSYNGKSYDIPLLTARFIQNRMRPTIDLLQHFDVLHAARRIWKNDFGNCTLITLERNLLHIERDGDIPGDEIPEIYKTYLRTFETSQLKKVIYHNQMDIVSMAALIGILNQNLCELNNPPELSGQNHTETRIVNLLQSTNEAEQAITRMQIILEQKAVTDFERAEIRFNLGMLHKRRNEWLLAEKHWLELIEQLPFAIPPAIELAKYYEHRLKNYQKALELTNRCLDFIQVRVELGKNFEEDYVLALQKRKMRIEKKISRTKPFR